MPTPLMRYHVHLILPGIRWPVVGMAWRKKDGTFDVHLQRGYHPKATDRLQLRPAPSPFEV